ncbi:MAG: TM0106 family RecB-like putative nuclease, partial [Deltaproteobacteria bacterium]|nr:TM0106 family RecB-like putative nuclease [Deltaproteobacteria bacterium]
MNFLTAEDLFNFAKCPHRPFMDFFADPQQKSFVHPLVQLLWHSGVQYEAKVIESFQKQFPHQKFIEMDPKQDLTEDLFLQTQEAMRAGYNFILYGALISENLAARPNFLIKMKGQSHWGDYHYVPMDIKMARVESSWDDGNEKLPKEQLWLLYFYADLLEKVQGVRPLHGSIYKTKSRQLRVYFNKPNEGYSTALQKLLDLHHSKPTDSRPVFSSNCKMCEWKSVCKDWIVQHNDCTQVYYVGSAMQQGLAQLNIHTPEDLAAQDPEILKPQI